MLQLGTWVQVGDYSGSIQAWGIEVGFAPNSKAHPVKRTSRRKAIASDMPMVLVAFIGLNDWYWYPVAACTPLPAPLWSK